MTDFAAKQEVRTALRELVSENVVLEHEVEKLRDRVKELEAQLEDVCTYPECGCFSKFECV